MREKIMYPRNFDDIKLQINFLYQLLEGDAKEQLILWENWFIKKCQQFNKQLDDNYYYKSYYDKSKYSLQIWKKNIDYDYLIYNYIANYYDEFTTEETNIIMEN